MVKSLQQNSHGPPGIVFDGNALDAKVTAAIGQFNREGRLKSPIQFMKVAGSLGKISTANAMEILNSLAGSEDRIVDPTGYICSAAQSCMPVAPGPVTGGFAGGAPPMMAPAAQGHGGAFNMEASFGNAGDQSGERYKTILCRHHEKDGSCVRGDNCNFAHGVHELSNPALAVFQGNVEKENVDASVRSQIATINKNPQITQQLHFRTVAPVLSMLEVPIALALLEELQNNITTIKNPTTWLLAAGKRKATGEERPGGQGKGKGKKGGGGWDGGWGDGWGGDAWGAMEGMVSQFMNPWGKGSWDGGKGSWDGGKGSWDGGKGSWDGGKGSWDGGKGGYKGGGSGSGNVAFSQQWTQDNLEQMIRKSIGYYNAQGDLQSPIMFRDLSPILLQLGPEAARAVLASLDGKQYNVQNPTKWLTKAAMNYTQNAADAAAAPSLALDDSSGF